MASRRSGKEGDDGRGLGADAWVPGEPGSQAHHIKRHGGQDVLQGVRAWPLYRARCRAQVRTPCEMVPSMPARTV